MTRNQFSEIGKLRFWQWLFALEMLDPNFNDLAIFNYEFSLHLSGLITTMNVNWLMIICKEKYNETEILIKLWHLSDSSLTGSLPLLRRHQCAHLKN